MGIFSNHIVFYFYLTLEDTGRRNTYNRMPGEPSTKLILMFRIKFSFRHLLACALVLTGLQSVAQEQRALIIGIDTYAPPEGVTPENDGGRVDFRDLDGCKNDAQAVKQLISLYSFPETNIRELYDRQATRDAILAQINNLLDQSKRGDIAFFYYAGHGSQMRNTRSGELDQRDESMVPSNTWQKGVSDIRDKELSALFNKFIDKGVKLTVIFDCCHSGSISRGPVYSNAPKWRYMPVSNFDVADATKSTPPETRATSGFLMISAAQDNEYAQEQYDNDMKPHGAFTIALMQAIQLNSIDVPVTTLFQSIRDILKSNGKKQEPVLSGTDERRHQNLFGVPATRLKDELVVSGSVSENGKIRLRGGVALGLNVGNELTLTSNEKIRIRISAIKGITESEAEMIEGKADSVSAGSLFRVTNWVSNTGPLLKLFLPKTVSYRDALQFAMVVGEVRKSPKIKWVQRIDETTPDVSVYYLNGKWMIDNNDNAAARELGAFTAANILAGSESKKPGVLKKLYIELPPTQDLSDAVNEQFSSLRNIKVVTEASAANYIIYGTVDQQGQLAYGLKRIEVSLNDSLEAMPLRTRWFALAANTKEANAHVADSLFEYSLRLGKVRGWLVMAPPKKASFFPYHIEVVHSETGARIDTAGVHVGDLVNIKLVANANYLSKSIPQKYIYVFAIDRNSKMTLLFPAPSDGNQGNKFPVRDDQGRYPADFLITEEARITIPTGTDNYFVLASETPLDNYAMLFTQDDVRGGDTRGAGNPLEDVLNMGNAKSRGTEAATPANWNLIRLSVKTRYK
jgi:hypothetical protein